MVARRSFSVRFFGQIAVVRKTRSPQTIGLDQPGLVKSGFCLLPPCNCAFQTMLSPFLTSQVNGRSFSLVSPRPVGPRQPGQSAAGLDAALPISMSASTRRVRGRFTTLALLPDGRRPGFVLSEAVFRADELLPDQAGLEAVLLLLFEFPNDVHEIPGRPGAPGT